MSRGSGGTPVMTPCQSPRKSCGSPRKSCGSPRKSGGSFSLDSTIIGRFSVDSKTTCGRFSLDSTAGSIRTDAEDADCWASPLPDRTPLGESPQRPGQMTPPNGWHSDHFEMNQGDDFEECHLKHRFSIEATYGEDDSWLVSR
jgi:hypothetical protein